MLRIAVVGLGRRAMGLLKMLTELDSQVTLAGLVDPNPQGVRQRLEEAGIVANNILVMESPASIVKNRDKFDGILIGTHCKYHTPIAVELAKAKLPLYLEKPVAVNEEQLEKLAEAYRGQEDRVVVSFPLRVTPVFQEVMAIIRSGRLGVINQIQAINNVPYGDVYYNTWYRSFDETGGLWLQKATHDIDYINLLAGVRPVSVAAMISRQVFDHTEAAEQTLKACKGDASSPQPNCEVRHQDSGSAIFMYENGLHAVYSQNFVTRHEAGSRGAIITGHAATLEFNWYGETIRVVDHLKKRVDQITVKSDSSGHGGGDHGLLHNFIKLMQGQEPSHTTLHDGILSAAMCLAARKSANTHQFVPIIVPGQQAPQAGPRAQEA